MRATPRFLSRLVLCLGLFAGGGALARDLTVGAAGVEFRAAVQAVYLIPFSDALNAPVLLRPWTGRLEDLRAMVESGAVALDVVQLAGPELARACNSGLVSALDPARLPAATRFLDGALGKCGLGARIEAVGLAYNSEKFGERKPESWADFWDIKRFPGRRALPASARFTLEFALLADGVPASEVYARLEDEAGVKEALARLGEIKSQVQWWTDPVAAAADLESGAVTLAALPSSALAAVRRGGNDTLGFLWPGSIATMDYWALPRGGQNTDQAYDLLNFVSDPRRQASLSAAGAFGPTRVDAVDLVDPDLLLDLVNAPENRADTLRLDEAFHQRRGAELEALFLDWAELDAAQQATTAD